MSDRNSTPTRRYGEIIGNIFGGGVGRGSSQGRESGEGKEVTDGGVSSKSRSVSPTKRTLSSGGVGDALVDLHRARGTRSQFSNLLDQSVSEEAKRRFRERRQQSLSPSRRSHHPMTVDMSNGRPATPERRQPPPESSTSLPKGSRPSTPIHHQQSQLPPHPRSATPPPSPRRHP